MWYAILCCIVLLIFTALMLPPQLASFEMIQRDSVLQSDAERCSADVMSFDCQF